MNNRTESNQCRPVVNIYQEFAFLTPCAWVYYAYISVSGCIRCLGRLWCSTFGQSAQDIAVAFVNWPWLPVAYKNNNRTFLQPYLTSVMLKCGLYCPFPNPIIQKGPWVPPGFSHLAVGIVSFPKNRPRGRPPPATPGRHT